MKRGLCSKCNEVPSAKRVRRYSGSLVEPAYLQVEDSLSSPKLPRANGHPVLNDVSLRDTEGLQDASEEGLVATKIPELDDPPESRAEYWDPVVNELLVRNQPQIRMGGLHLVDVRLMISLDHHVPSPYIPSEDQVSSFRKSFGDDAVERLDELVAKLGPSFKTVKDLMDAVHEFDEDPTGREPKIAGSDIDRLLNPTVRDSIYREGNDRFLSIRLLQQTKLYGLISRDKRAYIFPKASKDVYVSAIRTCDFAYSLTESVCAKAALHRLLDDKLENHFPCFSADTQCLIPFATGEVKVLGRYRKQREQQEVYATFFIMAQLILRAHMKGPDRYATAAEFFDGVRHCCFSISPGSLEIWEYRPKMQETTDQLRIQAQLLCSGHPCDERYMRTVYIPWRRHVMKRGILDQWTHLVPAVEAYAARPDPRPFSYAAPLILRVEDLKPGSYDLGSVTFSTAPSAERARIKEQILAVEDAAAQVAKAKKRKNLDGVSGSQTGTESQSLSGSFMSSLANLPTN